MNRHSLRKVINCIWLVVILILSGLSLRDADAVLLSSKTEAGKAYISHVKQCTKTDEMLKQEKPFYGNAILNVQKAAQIRCNSGGRSSFITEGMLLLVFLPAVISQSMALCKKEERAVLRSLLLAQYMKRADGKKANRALHRITG